MTSRIEISADHPAEDIIRRSAQIIQCGGTVIFPTRGLYGIGADALAPAALKRVFEIKKRPAHKPILVLVADMEMIMPLVRSIPPWGQPLMRAFWPGKVTFLFEAAQGLPAGLTGRDGKVGIRLPSHPVARALVGAVGRPLTATSANRSGAPAAAAVERIPSLLSTKVDLILDAGRLAGGPGSTVLDITVWPPAVLRPGAAPVDAIQRALDRLRPQGRH
jgi:L-threonylcarbamoyladenylate synthase